MVVFDCIYYLTFTAKYNGNELRKNKLFVYYFIYICFNDGVVAHIKADNVIKYNAR